MILAGALASRADNDDPIDLAVLGGLRDANALHRYTVTHFEPFDPVDKRTEATVTDADGATFTVSKGAPQVILALADDTATITPAVDTAVNDFAARGFRSLGVARADGDGGWRFLGVLPLFDPPREDATTTIATAKAMGVTREDGHRRRDRHREGDRRQGRPGHEHPRRRRPRRREEEGNHAVAESIETADGFAQVFPEHKYHIVDVLQQRGHIVGMTGDGVNDAPALKKADCGIAVSGATDAARAAAAIVLLTPGLSVIIDAIKESRKIFQRMNSYAMYRIAETLRVLLFMTVAILVFNFFPVTAIMIVMLALLNDGAILSIAYDNVRYKMQPEAWNMRLVLGIATVLGVIGPIAAFGLFYLGDRVFHLGHPQLQTMMYLMLSVAGHLTIFLTRTRGPFWSIRPARILLDRRPRHPGHRHPDRRLRTVHDTPGLGLGRVRLGLRRHLGPRQRPHQTARLPHPRPHPETCGPGDGHTGGRGRFHLGEGRCHVESRRLLHRHRPRRSRLSRQRRLPLRHRDQEPPQRPPRHRPPPPLRLVRPPRPADGSPTLTATTVNKSTG